MGKRTIVLHGCCKGKAVKKLVEAESREAATTVGAQPDEVRTPYYACALNQQVIAAGHDADVPEECVLPHAIEMTSDHTDTDWDQAIGELLADPANQHRIRALQLAHLPTDDRDETALGFHPTRQWSDVHVYLTRRHQPHGKEAVWKTAKDAFEAVGGDNYALIAHSLGSIVAAYLIGHEFVRRPQVFVTVGSQLGWSALRWMRWLEPFRLDGTWINIIDKNDLSAGFFTRDNTPKDNGFAARVYRDLWVTNTTLGNAHDFRGYMRTAEAITHVTPVLAS